MDKVLLAGLKDLTAMEILELIACAKTGSEEPVVKSLSANTIKDAKDALEWFIEVLEK